MIFTNMFTFQIKGHFLKTANLQSSKDDLPARQCQSDICGNLDEMRYLQDNLFNPVPCIGRWQAGL